MTKPTQAQIEAGLAVFANHYWDSFDADKFLILQHIKETLPRALTAAADVEDQSDIDAAKVAMQDHNAGTWEQHIVAATIERCAQVADTEEEAPGDMPPELKNYSLEDNIRAAIRATKKSIGRRIRALKDKP